MILSIFENQAKGIEREIYYFDLENYPDITEDELNCIFAFVKYEKSYGRETEIRCNDSNILSTINNAIVDPDFTKSIYMPKAVGFVYHATCINATCNIFSSGKLLSAAKVSGKTGIELAYDKQNSLWNDPADYFEYIMFCNGDDTTGDYVVLSENPPNEEDLLSGNFNAGIRFYIRYNDIIRHPGYVFDGYHTVKVKDEIHLYDYLHSCIVPEQYKSKVKSFVPPKLSSRVHYLSQDNLSISDWNGKVYNYVKNIDEGR